MESMDLQGHLGPLSVSEIDILTVLPL